MTASRDPWDVRVSDADREATVAVLHSAVAAGQLTLDEFSERAGQAYGATTARDLAAVTADLGPPRLSPATAAALAPVAPVRAPAGAPYLAVFGPIRVTPTTVMTPTGTFPLRGSTWLAEARGYVDRVTPVWAILVALLGFMVIPFVSLLFLLVKEDRWRGYVQVGVAYGDLRYAVRLPAESPVVAESIRRQVGYVRSVASAG